MSTTAISAQSKQLFGFYVSPATVYNDLIKYNIPVRSKSESVSLVTRPINYNKTYLNSAMIEWIDGFLLGDGSIRFSTNKYRKTKNPGYCRFSVASVKKQWMRYAISKFKVYNIKHEHKKRYNNERNPNTLWINRTNGHPDITKQAIRWYPHPECIKRVPKDIVITPTSVLLWYLGDGSLVNNQNIKLATCAFSDVEIQKYLIPKLEAHGIRCYISHWKKYPYIIIRRNSVGRFFFFIGKKSPVSCYDYKFKYKKWYDYKRLSDIIKNKKDKWRAIYYYKVGKLKCFKSPGNKFLLFNSAQEVQLKNILKSSRNHI